MIMTITPIQLQAASDAEYKALHIFSNRMRTEKLPDDPPTPLEDYTKRWRSIPPVIELFSWIIWDETETAVIAQGIVSFANSADNQHMLQFDIMVLPKYRAQGLGRRLMAEIATVAEREERPLLIVNTFGRIPDGSAFMRKMKATEGVVAHVNQLDLTLVNRELVQTWQARAKERATGFELGLWVGPYPEEQLEAIAALYHAINDQPLDDLAIEDIDFTPERLRQMEQMILADGTKRWSLYAYEKATGEFAGFTEVFMRPGQPQVVMQEMTCVLPEYRNLGLGRWLKAAMIDKILRERPQARFIRTDNADSNTPMLNINNQLGFEPYDAQTVWQVRLEDVQTYLTTTAQPA